MFSLFRERDLSKKNWKISRPKSNLGCSGWAGGLGKTCNSARSAIGEQCCPAGAACKWERLPNGVSVGKCRKLTEKGKVKQNIPFIIA